MESGVSRGSPLGCVVGILSVIPVSLTFLGSYGLFRIYQIPPDNRDPGALQMITWCTLGGVIGSVILLGTSIWILKRTDWKSYDPEKPTSQM